MCALGSPMTKFLKTEIPCNRYFSKIEIGVQSPYCGFLYIQVAYGHEQKFCLEGPDFEPFRPPDCFLHPAPCFVTAAYSGVTRTS